MRLVLLILVDRGWDPTDGYSATDRHVLINVHIQHSCVISYLSLRISRRDANVEEGQRLILCDHGIISLTGGWVRIGGGWDNTCSSTRAPRITKWDIAYFILPSFHTGRG